MSREGVKVNNRRLHAAQLQEARLLESDAFFAGNGVINQ